MNELTTTEQITTTGQITAIVTYGRGWPALAVTRSLGRRGVRVVCGDSVGFAPSTFSRYCARSFRYPDAGEDPQGFLAALEQVAREELARGGQVVLLPVHAETYLVARERARFEALGVRLALPSHEQIERTRDKGRLADLAEELGIRIPVTHRFQSVAEVYRAAPELSYPVFVKVRGAAAGVGIQKVDTPEELVRVYGDFVAGYELAAPDLPIVQEAVPGDDICVSALFDRGRCLAVHTYRNIRQFPRTTGAGVLRETVLAPRAEAEACRLLEHLGWHGLAQLDFRWGGEGEPERSGGGGYLPLDSAERAKRAERRDAAEPDLIELNPRFFGGLPQAIAAGVDYPWLLLQLALGNTPERPVIDPAPRTETPVLGLLATLGEIRRDEEVHAALARLKGTLRAEGEGRWERFWAFLRELGEVANPRNVAAYLRGKLAAHRGTINDVIHGDDPLPVLGVLFPLSVALKHGSLDTAVVLSEARKKERARPRVGLRGYLRPNAATLIATAAVFLVSVWVAHAPLLAGGLLQRAFAWPAQLSAHLPSGSAAGYALFHLVNACFLYALAATGLAAREGLQRARAT
ncbi:MAG: ATP-grasp domain-containing protein [Planctomycetota bacterium]